MRLETVQRIAHAHAARIVVHQDMVDRYRDDGNWYVVPVARVTVHRYMGGKVNHGPVRMRTYILPVQ